MTIFNSAGEHIKTLDDQYVDGPVVRSYTWDGTNTYGDKVASGVYVFYLTEPYTHQVKRILLVR